MKIINTKSIKIIPSTVFLILITACTATLAPNYDKVIADGLATITQNLLEHFASVASGSIKDNFVAREPTYNSLIGGIDSLLIRARTRPTLESKAIERVNQYLQEKGIDIPDNGVAPSVTALQKIFDTMTKMRNIDEKQGLTSLEVAAFKGQVVIYLDQALTYENFLKR